jgi:hypothetical protein
MRLLLPIYRLINPPFDFSAETGAKIMTDVPDAFFQQLL